MLQSILQSVLFYLFRAGSRLSGGPDPRSAAGAQSASAAVMWTTSHSGCAQLWRGSRRNLRPLR